MQLTQNFKLGEFYYTSHSEVEAQNREYALQLYLSLLGLSWMVLEPIRNHYEKCVFVTSGIRCPALNKAVGGDDESQHLFAEAADIVVQGVSVEQVWNDLKSGKIIPVKLISQCIWEKKNGREWLHIAMNTPRYLASSKGDKPKFIKIHD